MNKESTKNLWTQNRFLNPPIPEINIGTLAWIR